MKCSESKYAKCLYFTTNALARKVEKLAIESWKPVGLSPSHAYLLMMVIEEPGLPAGTIANHLQLTPSTVTRLIEKLETQKLLVRVSEGKLSNIYPTTKAKAMLPDLKNCIQDFYKKYSEAIGKTESQNIVSSLNKIADKL